MLAPHPRPPLDPPAAAELLPLVGLVSLKWLLAAEGVHLHVERAQHDLAYARATLERARASSSAALRCQAEHLARRIAHAG